MQIGGGRTRLSIARGQRLANRCRVGVAHQPADELLLPASCFMRLETVHGGDGIAQRLLHRDGLQLFRLQFQQALAQVLQRVHFLFALGFAGRVIDRLIQFFRLRPGTSLTQFFGHGGLSLTCCSGSARETCRTGRVEVDCYDTCRTAASYRVPHDCVLHCIPS